MATLTVPASGDVELTPWMRRFVRVGYAAKGAIYLLIGVLALRVAVGAGGRITDSSGVLETLAGQPFGVALLAVIGVGLLAYAAWEVAEGVWDAKRKGSSLSGWIERALSAIKGFVYGTIGLEALRIVVGDHNASQDPDDYARSAMAFPLGGVALSLVGAGILAYGLKQVWMAWHARFDDDLNRERLRREGGEWVLTVGRAGIGARGVILTLMGGAILRAGLSADPEDAGGTTEALWSLFTQPWGHWLLGAVAAGLMAYGVFQILHARYARL